MRYNGGPEPCVSHVLAIFGREIAALFGRPLAWLVLTLFLSLLAAGSLWIDDVLATGVATLDGAFFWMACTFVFVVPAVTMRLVAEEKRSGSLELLATLPVTSTEIVVGKWLAAVFLVAVALATSFSWPIALAMLGDLDWGPVAGGYLGLLFMGAGFAAIGTFTSSLTDSQVMAFLLSFVACLVPFAMGLLLGLVPGDWLPLVQYLTFEYHFANLARGVLDTRSLVFFGAVAVAGLEGARFMLERRRLS